MTSDAMGVCFFDTKADTVLNQQDEMFLRAGKEDWGIVNIEGSDAFGEVVEHDLAARQKLTSARIDLTRSQTDHAAWHADGLDRPQPCRRRAYRRTVPQARISLNRFRHRRFAQQTDSMTTAQLNLIDQHKRLISAVRTMQSSPETARKNPSFGDVLTAIGVGMASSNATSRTESLTDALTAYSNSLNTSSTSYLREIRALNSQRENRHSQQRMELLLNDLSNTLNGAQFNNGFWWKQR